MKLIAGAFGFSESVPPWVLALVAIFFFYMGVIVPFAATMSFLDRKLTADFQARVGPNRAGPAGLLQPIADLLKLLQKEDRFRMSWRERIWFSVHTLALYATVAVIPLGSLLILVDTDMSAILPFWAVLVLTLGTMLVGFSQGTLPGWHGAVRAASLTLAGAFPALVALLTAGVQAGDFRWSSFAKAQDALPLGWLFVSNPFQFIAFCVFVVSGLVMVGAPPMDGGMWVSDVHDGVAAGLSGRRLSFYRLGRFYGFFLWSVISVVVFCGAWNLPFGIAEALKASELWLVLLFLECGTLLTKTLLLMLATLSIARANPRGRSEQATELAWKVLGPMALISLAGTALLAGVRMAL